MDASSARQLANARLSIDEIVDGQLFLGGKRGAADLEALRSRRVTHIVNCTSAINEGALENFHPEALEYYRLALVDRPQSPLLPLLPAALEWAQAAIAGGGVVYAHCNAGSSRSGAFAVAFVMQVQRLAYLEALAAVCARRPAVKPNAGFRAHLREFQQSLDAMLPAAPLTQAEVEVRLNKFHVAPISVHSDSRPCAVCCVDRRMRRSSQTPRWSSGWTEARCGESGLATATTARLSRCAPRPVVLCVFRLYACLPVQLVISSHLGGLMYAQRTRLGGTSAW
eukprot:COSAG02_NODE_1931_length_10329_cov_7.963930_9_plen_282_part_00